VAVAAVVKCVVKTPFKLFVAMPPGDFTL